MQYHRLLLGKKRKITHPSNEGLPVHYISYHSELGLAVGLQGNELVGTAVIGRGSKRVRRESISLLADSLGKGVIPAITRHKPGRAPSIQPFADWKTSFDKLFLESDVEALEDMIASDLGLAHDKKPMQAGQQNELDGDTSMSNGAAEADDRGLGGPSREWRFPKDTSTLIDRTEKCKAQYCLSQLFEWQVSEDGTHNVAIRLYTPNVFKWLALTGYFTASALQQAIANDQQLTGYTVSPGDLSNAARALDPSLGVLQDWLSWSVHFELEEVVEALRAVVQSLESPPTAVMQRQVGGTTDDTTDNGGELDATVAQEFEAAEDDLAFALASLNDGLAIRSYIMRGIFTRLNSFPAERIIPLFRSRLSEQEIVFLVTLLRIELADGGWTTRYVDELDDYDTTDGPSDQSISVISRLLNIAIDAVGTSGWLVGLSGNTSMSTDEMLLILRAETSAALEGCYEAESLSTYLNDFERYSRRLRDTEGARPRPRKVDPVKNPGFLVDEAQEDPVLPLGYKVDSIDKTRLTKGGQVRTKSKGAMGKEISMKVGKYSIDRIRV